MSSPVGMMDTYILIPAEFELFFLTGAGSPRIKTTRTLYPGMTFHPDQGIIRKETLEIYDELSDNDVKKQFGCYDQIKRENDGNNDVIRNCNWVRFVRSTSDVTEVNVVAVVVHELPLFQVVRHTPADSELVVHFSVNLNGKNWMDVVKDFMIFNSGGPNWSSSIETPLRSPVQSHLATIPESPIRPRLPGVIPDSPHTTDSGVVSGRSDGSDESSVNSSPEVVPLEGSSLQQHGKCDTPNLFKRSRERRWLPCEVCGKQFDRPSLLRRHMRTHTGEKPHSCDVCGKAFSTSSSLNTHRRIHSGEKPHQCRVCGKRFTASSNLYYHRMTHNKEKPHKCTMCSKSFPTPGDLKSHMYVHNGSWPFRCPICDRGFSKQTNLKNHVLLHSGDKPHECRLCGKKFALQCNLKTHLKTHEGDPVDECRQCGKTSLSHTRSIISGHCRSCLQTAYEKRYNQGAPHHWNNKSVIDPMIPPPISYSNRIAAFRQLTNYSGHNYSPIPSPGAPSRNVSPHASYGMTQFPRVVSEQPVVDYRSERCTSPEIEVDN